MNLAALLKLVALGRQLVPLIKAAIPILIAAWGVFVDSHNGNAAVTTSLLGAAAAKIAYDVRSADVRRSQMVEAVAGLAPVQPGDAPRWPAE